MVEYVVKRNKRYLSETERVKIELWYKAGIAKAEIARRLGVHRSTITREIRQGVVEQLDGCTWKTYHVYSAQVAMDKHKWAQSSRSKGLKIGNNYAYLEAIERLVLDGHSLEESLYALGDRYGVTISKQTAYRYLRMGLFSRLTWQKLPQGQRKARRSTVRRVNLNNANHRSIEQRLKDIADRKEFGHWELDSVVGRAKGKSESCLVLTERKTRLEIVLKPEEKTADATVKALQKLHKRIGADWPLLFRTITCDNGSEFANQEGMEIDGVTVFYCHPRCPGERGTNENSNRLVRRKLPKGKSLAGITPSKAQAVQQWVNHYHRPMFGGRCSNDVFFDEIASLPIHDMARLHKFFY